MLKLIYDTGVFGPIDLEYGKPVIRVGSSEDNDLVLRHPSVKPHHGLLVFRGERVFFMPPSQELPLETDLLGLTGHGAGEQLWIGDLQFSLAHSSSSVLLPETAAAHEAPADSPAATNAESGGTVTEDRFYCSNCRTFVSVDRVKRIGLVGQRKLALCPKCGRALETDPASVLEAMMPEIEGKNTRKGLRGLLKEIMKSTA